MTKGHRVVRIGCQVHLCCALVHPDVSLRHGEMFSVTINSRKPRVEKGDVMYKKYKQTDTNCANTTACLDPAAISDDDIIKELLAKGVLMEKIRIPGHGKAVILHIADDFDAPLDDFAEYR